MNDFLDKLTQECFDVADDGKGKEYLGTPAGVKKFTQLIVQICAKMVRNSSLPDSYSEDCLEDIADELEELFGVKE